MAIKWISEELFCFEKTNLEDLQISRQHKATIIKIVWYFNKDRQIDNTRNQKSTHNYRVNF